VGVGSLVRVFLRITTSLCLHDTVVSYIRHFWFWVAPVGPMLYSFSDQLRPFSSTVGLTGALVFIIQLRYATSHHARPQRSRVKSRRLSPSATNQGLQAPPDFTPVPFKLFLGQTGFAQERLDGG